MDEKERELCRRTTELVDNLADSCDETPFNKALLQILGNLKGNNIRFVFNFVFFKLYNVFIGRHFFVRLMTLYLDGILRPKLLFPVPSFHVKSELVQLATTQRSAAITSHCWWTPSIHFKLPRTSTFRNWIKQLKGYVFISLLPFLRLY